jgi:hypothetical protein
MVSVIPQKRGYSLRYGYRQSVFAGASLLACGGLRFGVLHVYLLERDRRPGPLPTIKWGNENSASDELKTLSTFSGEISPLEPRRVT